LLEAVAGVLKAIKTIPLISLSVLPVNAIVPLLTALIPQAEALLEDKDQGDGVELLVLLHDLQEEIQKALSRLQPI